MAKANDQLLTYVVVAAIIYFAHKEGIINLNDIINEFKNLLKPGTGTTPTPPKTCPTGQTLDTATNTCKPNEGEEGEEGEEEENGNEEEEEEDEDEDSNLARVYIAASNKIKFEHEGLYMNKVALRENW